MDTHFTLVTELEKLEKSRRISLQASMGSDDLFHSQNQPFFSQMKRPSPVVQMPKLDALKIQEHLPIASVTTTNVTSLTAVSTTEVVTSLPEVSGAMVTVTDVQTNVPVDDFRQDIICTTTKESNIETNDNAERTVVSTSAARFKINSEIFSSPKNPTVTLDDLPSE